jgi:hypothetical protein
VSDDTIYRALKKLSRIDPRQRRQWLCDIAEKHDPKARRPAARRQWQLRAHRKQGIHHYRLWLSDRAVEG